jgi:hypothetical protein
MGATTAPITMPGEILRLCGVGADSDEFRRDVAEQLHRMVSHLAAAPATRRRR